MSLHKLLYGLALIALLAGCSQYYASKLMMANQPMAAAKSPRPVLSFTRTDSPKTF